MITKNKTIWYPNKFPKCAPKEEQIWWKHYLTTNEVDPEIKKLYLTLNKNSSERIRYRCCHRRLYIWRLWRLYIWRLWRIYIWRLWRIHLKTISKDQSSWHRRLLKQLYEEYKFSPQTLNSTHSFSRSTNDLKHQNQKLNQEVF